MSTAEIKVNIFELITQVDDESTLLRLYKAMKDVFEESKSDYSLSPEQEQQLLLAYEESFLEENLASHDEAMKAHAKWLQQ